MRKSGLIQVKGTKKGRGIPKITLVAVVNDKSIKEVIHSMTLNKIE